MNMCTFKYNKVNI